MLSDSELQSLRNLGNESEQAADEIQRYREALEQIIELAATETDKPWLRIQELMQIAQKALEVGGGGNV